MTLHGRRGEGSLLLATGPRYDVSVAEDGRGGRPEHPPDVGSGGSPAVVYYDVIGRNKVVRALAAVKCFNFILNVFFAF